MKRKEYELRNLFWQKYGTAKSMRDLMKEKGINYNAFLKFVRCEPIKDQTLWRFSEILETPVGVLIEMRENESPE